MKTVGVLLLFFIFFPAIAQAETIMWGNEHLVKLRSCPSSECGRLGSLMFREKTVILQKKDGWARITKYYNGMCENGLSAFVSEGNAACTAQNGFNAGMVAKWVPLTALALNKPNDPAVNATGDYALVGGSDGYNLYKDIFAQTARKLINDKRCTEADFREMGGWIKSSQYLNSPIYFTNCGLALSPVKIYLNTETGDVFN